jgi:hypothetical protein
MHQYKSEEERRKEEDRRIDKYTGRRKEDNKIKEK